MIQKATVADAKAIAVLAVQMWDSAAAAELEQEFVETLRKDSSAVYLDIEDGKAVGFAQCGLRQDYVEGTSSSPVGYLEGVFVEEAYRRRGIAGKLVEACEQWAVEKGCTEFASDCELDNAASIAFHQHMGFVEANRIVCFVRKL